MRDPADMSKEEHEYWEGLAEMANDSEDLYLFRWMVEMELTVQKSAVITNGVHVWHCLDVDGETLGTGMTAVSALREAHEFIDNPTDEEATRRQNRRDTEAAIDRADYLRDAAKDNQERRD